MTKNLPASGRAACTPAERWGLLWLMGPGRRREIGDYTPERVGGRLRHRLTFWVDGKRYRVGSVPMPGGGRIPIDSERMARSLLEHVRTQIQDGRAPMSVIAPFLARSSPESQISTWTTRWVERMAERVEAGERSPTYLRELRRYAGDGGHFSFWDSWAIWEVKPGALEDWLRWLAERDLSAKTRRNVLGAFQAFLRWLEQRGEILTVPRFPTVEVDEHAPTLLEHDVQMQVLDAIPEPRRGIFLALARLGLRPGEARALQTRDYRDGWLTVSRAVKGLTHDAPVRGTKTRRVRRLPLEDLAPDLMAWIDRFVTAEDRLKGTVPLFRHPASRHPECRWSYWALREDWGKACTAAGVEAPLYEGTKHSLATALLSRGIRREVVQYLLGHSDERTTARYAKLSAATIVRELRKP